MTSIGRRTHGHRIRPLVAALAGGFLVLGILGIAVPAGATSTAVSHVPPPAPTTYQLSLGDSLAAGTGASTPAKDYVNLVGAHEQHILGTGLVVENLACGGATTTTMLNGGGSCSYSAGSQLAQAEQFLTSHAGLVPYITIDIGANNVDNCVSGSSINTSCVIDGLNTVNAELPQIVAGLQAAAPNIPIFGMDYYDPFLQQWVLGTAEGQSVARLSASLSAVLNSDMTKIYGAAGGIPIDLQGPFAVQDFAMTGSFQGTVVPENVSRTCAWTHMCDSNGSGGYTEDIHTNDIGHRKIATAFETAIDKYLLYSARGTWLTDSAGGVNLAGNAPGYGSLAGKPLNKPIVAMAPTSNDGGYWLVASDGGVFSYGNAQFFGSTGAITLNKPIVGFVPTPDDQGYWLVASDGGIFSYGDATFLGSMGGTPLNQPVVGMASSGSGKGYWLVAADGGIFSFGDAAYHGSTGGTTLNKPIVGMSATVDGNGYWLVASDGGIFSFGDASFHGSTGAITLNKPIIGMTMAPSGWGYTLGASDGGVFDFGTAYYAGPITTGPPVAPVVAIATN